MREADAAVGRANAVRAAATAATRTAGAGPERNRIFLPLAQAMVALAVKPMAVIDALPAALALAELAGVEALVLAIGRDGMSVALAAAFRCDELRGVTRRRWRYCDRRGNE